MAKRIKASTRTLRKTATRTNVSQAAVGGPRFPPEIFERIVSHLDMVDMTSVCDDIDRSRWMWGDYQRRRALVHLTLTSKSLYNIAVPILYRHLLPLSSEKNIRWFTASHFLESLESFQVEWLSDKWRFVRSLCLGDIRSDYNVIETLLPNIARSIPLDYAQLTHLKLAHGWRAPNHDFTLTAVAKILHLTPNLRRLHMSMDCYRNGPDTALAAALANLRRLEHLEIYMEVGDHLRQQVSAITPRPSNIQFISITGVGLLSDTITAYIHSLVPRADLTMAIVPHIHQRLVYEAWPEDVRNAITAIDLEIGYFDNKDANAYVGNHIFPHVESLFVKPRMPWIDPAHTCQLDVRTDIPVGTLPATVRHLHVLHVEPNDVLWALRWTATMIQRSSNVGKVRFSAAELCEQLAEAEYEETTAKAMQELITEDHLTALRRLLSTRKTCKITIEPRNLEESLVNWLKKGTLRPRKKVNYA